MQLAQEQKRQDLAEQLSLHTLAASGDGKAANKQINKWMSEDFEPEFEVLPEDRPTNGG